MTASKSLSTPLELALDLHQRGRIGQARDLYLQALEANPNDFDARVLLTALEGQCKHYPQALTHITRAIEIDPANSQLLHNQGLLYFELCQFNESVQSFSKALALRAHEPSSGLVQTLYGRAKAWSELNEFERASKDFAAALQTDPLFVNAWLELGNLSLKHLSHWSASDCFWSGLAAEPSHAALWCNLGQALTSNHQHSDATRAFERSLWLNARDPNTHFQLGLTLQSQGHTQTAQFHLHQAVTMDSSVAAYHYACGLVHLQLSEWSLAIESLNAGLKLHPRHAEAYYNRGLAQQQLQQYDLALESFNKALYWRGDFAQAHYSRGIIFYELKFHELAIEQYNLALEYQPNYFEALTNKGIAQKELKRLESALDNYQRALSINPEFSQAYNNLGNVRLDLRQPRLALESFNWALMVQPSNVIALTNRANIYHDLKDFERATRSYELAILVDPSHVDAHWNLALSQLSLGHYERGWSLYEHRWQMPNFSTSTRRLSEPLWLGDTPLQGKTLLLQAEQGLGDSLQFCRFIPDVLALGAKVMLEVPTPLLGIMKESFSDLECITDQASELGHFDLYCPLMSLPKALGVTLQSLGRSAPLGALSAHLHTHYLRAPETKLNDFSEWLKRESTLHPSRVTHGPKAPLRVGLNWRGNPKHQNDLHRSLCLDELMTHLPLDDPRFHFISLQKDAPHSELERLSSGALSISNAAPELLDFTDTAALLSLLDLVICVDTSVAHLSGALFKRTWILLAANPDWRWLFEREDTPWYPSARLFRQEKLKDWSPVLSHLTTELLDLAKSLAP